MAEVLRKKSKPKRSLKKLAFLGSIGFAFAGLFITVWEQSEGSLVWAGAMTGAAIIIFIVYMLVGRGAEHTEDRAEKAAKRIDRALVLLGVMKVFLALTLGWTYLESINTKFTSLVAGFSAVETIEAAASNVHVKSNYGFEFSYDEKLYGGIEADRTATNEKGTYIVESWWNSDDAKAHPNFNLVILSFSDATKALGFGHSVSIVTPHDKNKLSESRLLYAKGEDVDDIEVAVRRHIETEKKFNSEEIGESLFVKKRKSRERVSVGGTTYERIIYETSRFTKKDKTLLYVYKDIYFLTVQNQRIYSINIQGIPPEGGQQETLALGVISSITYSAPSGEVMGSTERIDESAKLIALFTPAVVRISTIYCSEFELLTKTVNIPMDKTLCTTGSGSGFIISKNGYVGTNRDVVRLTPAQALSTAILNKDKSVTVKILKFILGSSKPNAELEKLATETFDDTKLSSALVDVVLSIPTSKFKINSESSSYAVRLGNEPIKSDSGLTGAPVFNYNNSIVVAEIVGKGDGDVALLKMSGDNYPNVVLGSIASATAGSEIFVVSFSGKDPKVTATRGNVSSIIDHDGGIKKVIQSDISISAGGSGGPAFNGKGEVIGLATYGAYDAKATTFSYIRDIAELNDAISTNNVTLTAGGSTQSEWEKGLKYFWASKYTPSIKSFNKVKVLYPAHPLADDFINIAKEKIAAGEEQKSIIFTLLPVLILLTLSTGIFSHLVKVKKAHLATLGTPTPPENLPK